MKHLINSARIHASFTIFLSVINISACSVFTAPDNKPSINNLVIKNLTLTDVNDVEIRVEKLKGIFNCNLILTDSFCSNGFRERAYENNQITISWTGRNQRHAIGPITINISQALIAINEKDHKPYTAVIELRKDGEFDAYFELPNPKQ